MPLLAGLAQEIPPGCKKVYPPETVVHVQSGDGGEPKLTIVKGAFEVPPMDPYKGAASMAHFTSADIWLRAAVAPTDFLIRPGDEPSADPGFGVLVHLRTYSQERKIEYRRWKGIDAKDDLGNSYRQITFRDTVRLSAKQEVTRIDGLNGWAQDLIVFERAVPKAKHITFKLPGANLGLPGDFELKVTRSTVNQVKELQDKFLKEAEKK